MGVYRNNETQAELVEESVRNLIAGERPWLTTTPALNKALAARSPYYMVLDDYNSRTGCRSIQLVWRGRPVGGMAVEGKRVVPADLLKVNPAFWLDILTRNK